MKIKTCLYILLLYFFPMSVIGSGIKEVNLQYSPKDFFYNNNGNGTLYVSSHVHSIAYGPDCDSPALPLLRVGYLIGGNEAYENVSMASEEELILSDVTIAPNPTAIETSAITDYKTTPMAVDYKSRFYPNHEIRYTGTHQMGGYKFITFLVCPFKYDATARKLYLKTHITLSIQTSEPNGKDLSVKTIPAIAYEGNCLMKNLKNLVVNYDQIENLYGKTQVSYNTQNRNSTNYKYLIVTRDSLKSAFQNLADWKTTKGCRSKVLTIEHIDSQYTGSSREVRIKKALKDYYDGTHSGLQYVLLGGEPYIVPSQFCYIKFIKIKPNQVDTIIYEDRTPTDMYYACFDNNFEWNANVNNKFGEIGDSVDLVPEIVVTRVPIQTVNQAIAFVNRIINYERNPNVDNWENKILMGGHKVSDWDENNIYSDAEINADSLYKKYIQPYWSNNRTKLFNTKEGNTSNIFTATNLQGLLGQGYTFVDIATHGHQSYWDARFFSERYHKDFAQSLINTGSTIITTVACHTNYFASSCLSKAFMSNTDSGVLGYLGCSREGWAYLYPSVLGYSFDYNGEFYKKLFTESNGRFGEAVTHAKETFTTYCSDYFTPYRWIMFGLNPVGDPEMPVFLHVPMRFDNLSISFSNGTLNVNTGESDCTICVSSASDSGESYYEVQNGTIASFSSVLDGYTVCITKPGFIPFVATCSNVAYIQNESIDGNYNVVSGYVYVGSDVTTSKPQGEVVIQSGNVEIHGMDGVTIKNDFQVQTGATLKIVTGN